MKDFQLLIISLFLTIMMFTSVSHAARAPLPYNNKIRTTIKNIENYGNFVVINLSRDVPNDANCRGPFLEGFDDSTITGKIRTFYLDITTDNGKKMYASVLVAAAARKKTEFKVSSCDSNTDLPIVDVVSTLY